MNGSRDAHAPPSSATATPAIEVLAPEVANQIAAGEVVERPASVLKELVENALDAGARSVTVTLDGGGVTRLAVTDDGAGMSVQDLALSVVRHATSKIRTADDLIGVGTYGFRGEALASIASVARVRITSRKREPADAEGHELLIEGSATAKVTPAGCAVGTTVSVEDLFFNTPARRKFLRTTTTEASNCLDVLARLAIPRPDVRFVLRKDGKVSREWLRYDTVAPRAKEIFPGEDLIEMRGSRGGVSVLALLGPPERARGGTSSLALYVNGRHVKDRLLMRAVAQAYGSVLENGRYPSGALLIEVPTDQVDVNVHPQKSEVRFATQNDVFSAVVAVLRDGLVAAPWARQAAGAASQSLASSGPAADFWAGRFGGGPTVDDAKNAAANAPAVLPKSAPASLFDVPVSAPKSESAKSDEASVPARALGAFVQPPNEPDPWGLTPRPPYPPASYASAAADAMGVSPEPAREETPAAPRAVDAEVSAAKYLAQEAPGTGAFGTLHYVAQLRRMFLLCEGEHGVVILDQHAAAERVTFDRLRKAFLARTVATQPLLVPESIEVTAREVALVEERGGELARVGVELTPSGPTTLSVRAVPAVLGRADPRRLARDVLAELGRHGNDFSRAVDLVLATMACHGSVRAGDELADEEARALLRSMDDVDFAGHCPHGRPVVWTMRWGELERRVGR